MKDNRFNEVLKEVQEMYTKIDTLLKNGVEQTDTTTEGDRTESILKGERLAFNICLDILVRADNRYKMELEKAEG